MNLPKSGSQISTPRAITPLGPRADTYTARPDKTRGSDRYIQRGHSLDRDRRDYERDDVMDGSYGFDDRMDTDDRDNKGSGGGLYSDNLIGSRGRGGNSRDRGGRGGDRSRGYR